jgi:hypothetical protein
MGFVGIALMLFGLVWAAGFGFAYFQAAGKARAAESWPATIGRVISAEVRVEQGMERHGERSVWYNPVVRYTYQAAGRSFEGARLRFGETRNAKRNKAEEAIAPYRPGASVTVRYDPDKPHDAVIETVKPGPLYLAMAAVGLLFLGFGSLVSG